VIPVSRLRRVRRLLLTAMSGVLLAGLVSACSAGSASRSSSASLGPRPLTAAEAQRLAVIRFKNYDAGVRGFSLVLPSTQATFRFDGFVDFATSRAYAQIHSTSTTGPSLGLVLWDKTKVENRPAAVTTLPFPPPTDGWSVAPLSPTTSVLHTALALILDLGSDRPENPTLLQQSTARWLRKDKVGPYSVDVIAGPAAQAAGSPSAAAPSTSSSVATPNTSARGVIHYWIDSTGILYRVDTLLETNSPTVFDFGPGGSAVIPPMF
jgi:hypothetical protein